MPGIFEVKFMVDERKLGASLWALDGIALGKPEATPVRGAKPTRNGKIKAVEPPPEIKPKRKGKLRAIDKKTTPTGKPMREGSITKKLAIAICDTGKTHITGREIHELAMKAGGSAKATGGFLMQLQKHQVISRYSEEGLGYEILTSKE